MPAVRVRVVFKEKRYKIVREMQVAILGQGENKTWQRTERGGGAAGTGSVGSWTCRERFSSMRGVR